MIAQHTPGPWFYEPPSGGVSDPTVGIQDGSMAAHVVADNGEILVDANYDDCQSDENVRRRNVICNFGANPSAG